MLDVDSFGDNLSDTWARVSDLMAAHRRAIAALLAGVAVICGLSALRSSHVRTVAVWAAARDLTGGAPLTRADVRLERLPVPDIPAGTLPVARAPTGEVLAAPVRRGEPLTDVRLLSAALLRSLGAGEVAVPVRITDGPATLALVRTGDSIDILAAPDDDTGDGDTGTSSAATAEPVVADVRVLAVPSHVGSDGDGLVIVGASSDQAAALAGIPSGERVSIAVRRTR